MGAKIRISDQKSLILIRRHTTPMFAGDATASYDSKKCKLALRQFIFVSPNHFVVFDRVISTRPDYKKTWLFHTAREPSLTGSVFSAVHEEGRVITKTLLPKDAILKKIGGPGRQFMAGGRNWSLPKSHPVPATNELFGQWRMEIAPKENRKEDFFLHLIQVGDLSLTKETESTLVDEGNRIGLTYRYNKKVVTVLFAKTGKAAGFIQILDNGQVVVEQPLSDSVLAQ